MRKFKSSSAFGVRRDDHVSNEHIEVKTISRPKTSVKKERHLNDLIASVSNSNDTDSYTKIKISNDINLLESPSQPDFDEVSSRNQSPKKQTSFLKPTLKRPNTSLAVFSTIKATEDSDFNQEYLLSLKENFKSRSNPTTDTRYKSLVNSMNKVYTKENKLEQPSERVRNLIRSNKALQGAGWNGDVEKEKKTRYELDSNKKLFEKAASDIF